MHTWLDTASCIQLRQITIRYRDTQGRAAPPTKLIPLIPPIKGYRGKGTVCAREGSAYARSQRGRRNACNSLLSLEYC
jgi:hypothetical protein